MPAATFAAIGIFSGLAVIAVLPRFTNPAASAAASHVIEYCVGEPVTAL